MFLAHALDDDLAGSSCGCSGLIQLFDGRSDITTHKRPLQIARTREFDVPHGLAIAFEDTIRVGKGRAKRKAEIDLLFSAYSFARVTEYVADRIRTEEYTTQTLIINVTGDISDV
jgi:hypothetical protein